jgi:hypothetical protein
LQRHRHNPYRVWNRGQSGGRGDHLRGGQSQPSVRQWGSHVAQGGQDQARAGQCACGQQTANQVTTDPSETGLATSRLIIELTGNRASTLVSAHEES